MGLISSFYNQGRGRPGKATNPKPHNRVYKGSKPSNASGIAAAYDKWQEELARQRHNSGLTNKDHAQAQKQKRKAFAVKKGRTHTYIYALADPRTDEYRYIGKSNWPRIRYHQHIEDLDKCNHQKTAWLQEMASKKIKPRLVILEKCRLEDWKDRERSWIKNVRHKLVNMTKGGDQSSH